MEGAGLRFVKSFLSNGAVDLLPVAPRPCIFLFSFPFMNASVVPKLMVFSSYFGELQSGRPSSSCQAVGVAMIDMKCQLKELFLISPSLSWVVLW